MFNAKNTRFSNFSGTLFTFHFYLIEFILETKLLKFHCTTFIFFIFLMFGTSQSKQLEVNVMVGKIWKHKSSLLYKTPLVSSAIQISYFRPLRKKGYWDQVWNVPKVGISFMYLSFGDRQVLGNAYAIFPEIKFNLVSKNKFNLGLNSGFGIARLSVVYNEVSNPINNAIGSHINNISKIGLWLEKRAHSYTYKIGGDFIHFSNGGTQSPNSGINVVTGTIGLIKHFGLEKQSTDQDNSRHLLPEFKTHGFNINYHYGLTEDDVPNGPKYPIHALSLSYFKSFSPRYRLHLGAEYEYNSANYQFAINIFTHQKEAKRQARQIILILANEFFIVNYSFRLQTGFYTNYPTNFRKGAFYFKLISQYHFKLPKSFPFNKFSIGVMMKSHWAKAENLGLVLGIDI